MKRVDQPFARALRLDKPDAVVPTLFPVLAPSVQEQVRSLYYRAAWRLVRRFIKEVA